jgi:ATP-dependent Clp protease ATP-binding subunit ClpC
LLLGLLRLGSGVAFHVLDKKGVTLESVRKEIANKLGTQSDLKVIGTIPYTPRAKKILAFAAREAKALNHTYVGTEHILLGLMREGENVGAKLLQDLGVDLKATRNEILRAMDPSFGSQES